MNVNSIKDFYNLLILNKDFYLISKMFLEKKEYLLIKYFVLNNNNTGYINFKKHIQNITRVNFIKIQLDYNSYFNELIIKKNGLRYYNLHYLYELIIISMKQNQPLILDNYTTYKEYAYCVQALSADVFTLNNRLKMFVDRITSSIKFDNNNKINDIISIYNLKNDDFCNRSLNYLTI